MPGPFYLEQMKMRKFQKRLIVPSLLLAVLSGLLLEPVFAGDLAAGRAKAQVLCENCHGVNGIATLPGAANLSGQQKEYLREQLRAFRSGSRRNDQMSVIAKILTDAEIENLSDWYSAMKVTVEMPK